MEQQKGFVTDNAGNKSSKRIAGFITGGAALAMSVTLFAISIKSKVADPATALTIIKTLAAASFGLLGIGVVELFGKKK